MSSQLRKGRRTFKKRGGGRDTLLVHPVWLLSPRAPMQMSKPCQAPAPPPKLASSHRSTHQGQAWGSLPAPFTPHGSRKPSSAQPAHSGVTNLAESICDFLTCFSKASNVTKCQQILTGSVLKARPIYNCKPLLESNFFPGYLFSFISGS